MENKDNVIDITDQFEEIPKEGWTDKLKRKAKVWWEKNALKVMIYGPIVAGVASEGIKFASKHHKAKMEQRNKDLRCWDPSIGHYWELSRKLDNKDWKEINRRHSRGESLGEIFADMNVLK